MPQTVFRFLLRTFFLRSSRLLASPFFWSFRINSATFFARHRRNSLHRRHHFPLDKIYAPIYIANESDLFSYVCSPQLLEATIRCASQRPSHMHTARQREQVGLCRSRGWRTKAGAWISNFLTMPAKPVHGSPRVCLPLSMDFVYEPKMPARSRRRRSSTSYDSISRAIIFTAFRGYPND